LLIFVIFIVNNWIMTRRNWALSDSIFLIFSVPRRWVSESAGHFRVLGLRFPEFVSNKPVRHNLAEMLNKFSFSFSSICREESKLLIVRKIFGTRKINVLTSFRSQKNHSWFPYKFDYFSVSHEDYLSCQQITKFYMFKINHMDLKDS